jgi:hypothetical protein
MHVDSVSILEPAASHTPSRRKRKHRLAHYQPVPKGDECLPLIRAQELFRGKPWKAEEEDHCQACAWCWYFVSHDERECFKSRQLLEISSGRDLTEEEWEHAAVCPACAYDYDQLRQEKSSDD